MSELMKEKKTVSAETIVLSKSGISASQPAKETIRENKKEEKEMKQEEAKQEKRNKETETVSPKEKEKGKDKEKEKKEAGNKMEKKKKKGKRDEWVKKEKQKKEIEMEQLSEEIMEKNKPNFWGRFGKKNFRKQRMDRYNKWRKPRGIDIIRKKAYGSVPQTGYRTPKRIRGKHPSGYEEVRVFSQKDLGEIRKNQAVKIASSVGRRKRIQLIKKANEKKIQILN